MNQLKFLSLFCVCCDTMTCIHGYCELCHIICNLILYKYKISVCSSDKVCLHSFISTKMQVHKTAVEKNLVRARKLAKDLLDERVMVNAESEQKKENLNVSIIIVFGGQCATCIGALHCVGKVNGAQTAGCAVGGTP